MRVSLIGTGPDFLVRPALLAQIESYSILEPYIFFSETLYYVTSCVDHTSLLFKLLNNQFIDTRGPQILILKGHKEQ